MGFFPRLRCGCCRPAQRPHVHGSQGAGAYVLLPWSAQSQGGGALSPWPLLSGTVGQCPCALSPWGARGASPVPHLEEESRRRGRVGAGTSNKGRSGFYLR